MHCSGKLQKKQEFEVTTSCKQLWSKLAGEDAAMEAVLSKPCDNSQVKTMNRIKKKAQKTAWGERTGSGKICDEHCSTEQQ